MAGFAIVSNNAFPTDSPAFGEIVAGDALEHAARISSANNNIDLSDNEYSHTNVSDISYSSAGVTNGAGNAYIQTNFDNKADNSFTIYCTAKADLNGQSSYSTWLCGNFVGTAAGGLGIYIRSETDPNNAGKLRVIARASITRKRVSDGVFGSSFADLILLDNLTVLPSSLEWLVLAMEFDLSTRVQRMRNVITGASVTVGQTDSDWVVYDFSGANRNSVPSNVPNHRLLFAASTLDNTNTMTLGEHFYWSRLLTPSELAEQLSYSRAFMSANRGVNLP